MIEDECRLFAVYWGFTTHMPVMGSGPFPSGMNQSTRAHGMTAPRWVIDNSRRTRATCMNEKPGNVVSVATSTQSRRGTAELPLPCG